MKVFSTHIFATSTTHQMHLKTIFNRVTEYKPFVVEHVVLVEHHTGPTIEISMRAREKGYCQMLCSKKVV